MKLRNAVSVGLLIGATTIVGCGKDYLDVSLYRKAQQDPHAATAKGGEAHPTAGNGTQNPDPNAQNHLQNAAIAGQNQTAPTPTTPTGPTEKKPTPRNDYFGNNLHLSYPSTTNWGYVRLPGQDGKALYNALQIIPERGNPATGWVAPNVKKGQNVACFEGAKTSAPQNSIYECYVYINYRTGSANTITTNVKADHSAAPGAFPEHSSTNLQLSVQFRPVTACTGYDQEGGGYAVISFSGYDAFALYGNMHIAPVRTKTGADAKKGQNILCTRTGAEYSCSLYIDSLRQGTAHTIESVDQAI